MRKGANLRSAGKYQIIILLQNITLAARVSLRESPGINQPLKINKRRRFLDAKQHQDLDVAARYSKEFREMQTVLHDRDTSRGFPVLKRYCF